MKEFKLFYGEEGDILYFASESEEAEVVEIAPEINMGTGQSLSLPHLSHTL
jgi:hypothetical protein